MELSETVPSTKKLPLSYVMPATKEHGSSARREKKNGPEVQKGTEIKGTVSCCWLNTLNASLFYI